MFPYADRLYQSGSERIQYYHTTEIDSKALKILFLSDDTMFTERWKGGVSNSESSRGLAYVFSSL